MSEKREDLARRALEDLDREDVTADAWVQVYGRRLAEELSASQALMNTSAETVKATRQVFVLSVRLMSDLQRELTAFQAATHWFPGRTKTLKATALRWSAALRFAAACHRIVKQFFPAVSGAAAAAPASLLHDDRKDPKARAAREGAAARLKELLDEVRSSGSTGPATDRFVETVDLMRVKMRGVDLRPGDEEGEEN